MTNLGFLKFVPQKQKRQRQSTLRTASAFFVPHPTDGPYGPSGGGV